LRIGLLQFLWTVYNHLIQSSLDNSNLFYSPLEVLLSSAWGVYDSTNTQVEFNCIPLEIRDSTVLWRGIMFVESRDSADLLSEGFSFAWNSQRVTARNQPCFGVWQKGWVKSWWSIRDVISEKRLFYTINWDR